MNRGAYRFWETNEINQIVNPNDHKFIHGIHLSRSPGIDHITWKYCVSGIYTVKSGYWLLTHDPRYNQVYLPIPHASTTMKRKIWKVLILPKIKHFLWRILSKALATCVRLNTRGNAHRSKMS